MSYSKTGEILSIFVQVYCYLCSETCIIKLYMNEISKQVLNSLCKLLIFVDNKILNCGFFLKIKYYFHIVVCSVNIWRHERGVVWTPGSVDDRSSIPTQCVRSITVDNTRFVCHCCIVARKDTIFKYLH